MSIAPAQSQPQIVTPQGRALSWDDEDRLWLLRAVEAEGEPRDLVAQTLVNRFAWLWDQTPGKYVKLGELVRAYSQPVNPAWFPDGKLFLASLERLPDGPARLQAQQRAAARRDVHSKRQTFSPGTTTAVNQALRGPIVIPPGALHFAAANVASTLPVLVPAANDRQNVIYGEAAGRGARARYSLSQGGSAQVPAALGKRGATTSGHVAAVVGAIALGLGIGLGIAHLK